MPTYKLLRTSAQFFVHPRPLRPVSSTHARTHTRTGHVLCDYLYVVVSNAGTGGHEKAKVDALFLPPQRPLLGILKVVLLHVQLRVEEFWDLGQSKMEHGTAGLWQAQPCAANKRRRLEQLGHNNKQTTNQPTNQPNKTKQTSKQANKQTSKQANKQTNKH